MTSRVVALPCATATLDRATTRRAAAGTTRILLFFIHGLLPTIDVFERSFFGLIQPSVEGRCGPLLRPGDREVSIGIPLLRQSSVSCSLTKHASRFQRERRPYARNKTGQATISLSRFRDLLPSRPGRPAPQRASGLIASELQFNIHPWRRPARWPNRPHWKCATGLRWWSIASSSTARSSGISWKRSSGGGRRDPEPGCY